MPRPSVFAKENPPMLSLPFQPLLVLKVVAASKWVQKKAKCGHPKKNLCLTRPAIDHP